MRQSIVLLSALSLGCGPANAHSDPPVVPAAPADVWSDANRELVLDGAAGTTESLEGIADRLDDLDPATRAKLREAASVLQVNCPYNRAAFQLPLALSLAVDAIDANDLDWGVRHEWRRIQAGLRRHVDVLALMGGEPLDEPIVGDYLLGMPEVTNPIDLAAGDPLPPTQALIDAVPELVAGYPPAIQARIEEADRAMRTHTHEAWPLKLELIGWRRALMSVRVHVNDPQFAARIDTMVAMISKLVEQRC